MLWLALLVIAAFLLYAMPEERARAFAFGRRWMGETWGAVRSRRTRSDPFGEALDARSGAAFLTWILVFLNVAVFISMVAGPGAVGDPGTLERWGASVAPLTTNDQWWRLIAAAFVHAAFVPLVVDLLGLWQAGVFVERIVGHAAFAGVYLACAVLGAAIGLSLEPMAVTTGASGAVFGIYGVLLATLVRGLQRRSPLTIPVNVLRTLAPAAAVFILYYTSTAGAVRTAGAVTFATGFAIGLVLAKDVDERKAPIPRVLVLTAAALAIAAAIAAPMRGTTDVRPELARLVAVEERTARVYQAAVEQFKLGAIKAPVLAQLIDRSILPELHDAQARLDAVRGVAREHQPLVADAKEYLRLRSESWRVRSAALRKSSMRMLRDADEKERTSLGALDRIKPAVEGVRI